MKSSWQLAQGGSGEANAWHLKVVLDLKNFRRVRLDGVQGTLTASKIVEAIVLRHSEKIVERFVKSHEARLVIDHLVYFCVSDWLSKYFRNKIFIGRLQALAIQEIVQREREIQGLRSSTTTKTPSRFSRGELLSELKYKGRWGTSEKAAESAIGSNYFTEDGDGKLIQPSSRLKWSTLYLAFLFYEAGLY